MAKYLQRTLETDLRAAGRLDPSSSLVVGGLLTASSVDPWIGTGSATLSATFTLLRHEQKVFEKDLRVQSRWHSSFVGAEAIPDAINQYTALYQMLVEKLLSDPDFEDAARGR